MCGTKGEVLRCAKCKMTHYCSKKCQKLHFEHHNPYCTMIEGLKEVERQKIYGDLSVRQIQVNDKTRKKLIRLVGDKPVLRCRLGGKEVEVLWDTGSMVSLVDRRWIERNLPDAVIHPVADFLESDQKELCLKAANSTKIRFDGVAVLDFAVGDNDGGFVIPVLVASDDINEPILGYNVIEYLILNGSPEEQTALQTALKGRDNRWDLEPLSAVIQENADSPDFLTEVKSSSRITVPAGRKVQVRCRIKAQGNDLEQAVYFQPVLTESEDDLTFLETVSTLKCGRTNFVTVEVMNLSASEKVLSKGRVVGSIHSVSAVLPMLRRKDIGGNDTSEEKVEVEVGGVNAEESENGGDSEEDGVAAWDLSHLDKEKREVFDAMLRGVSGVFSKDDSDIGEIPDFQMPIHVEDKVPVTAAYRRIPPHLYQEVKHYIDDLLANGWIRESYSAYSSPIVCVRKKDGSMRICVDYRKLNLKTRADAQPIPRIQDILDKLGGQKWFTTLDMSKAYHQGYIAEEFRHLTAFITPWTLYEWVRIPFGLRNAPPAFQRYMNQVLRDLKGFICEPYLDDILGFSKTFEQHVADVEVILKRLMEKGIKLRAKKCHFAKQEVRYLGRLISSEGYRPDPQDTEALERFREPPKTVGELRSILGLLGYYRAYVKDFSRKVKPIYELLTEKGEVKEGKRAAKKPGQKYDSKGSIAWTEAHQVILDQMIDLLKSPEVVAFPDYSQPFYMNCDASNQGLGAVLYQKQEGRERVISYASRTLTESEKNYHMHSGKLEFLALKWAITDRFADYFCYGLHPFTVYTDNNPLTYVLTSAKLNAVGMRWVNELADFNFTIKYRPGKENIDADSLSRKPRDVHDWTDECTETVDPRCMRAVVSGIREAPVEVSCMRLQVESLSLKSEGSGGSVPREELMSKQKNDDVVGPVYTFVAAGSRPARKEWSQLSREIKVLLKSFNKLSVENGILRFTLQNTIK